MAKPSWITLSDTSGSGDNSFIITAAKHTGRLPRTGTVVVKGNGMAEDKKKTITISQAGLTEFVEYHSTTYAVDKGGETITITGKTNSPYLNFTLVGADANTNQMQFISAEGNVVGTTHNSETANTITLPATFTAGTKTLPISGNTSDEGIGGDAEYVFSIQVPVSKNTGELEQQIKLKVQGSSSQFVGETVITLAAGDKFLKVFTEAGHENELTTLKFATDGESKTAYVDSNTSWTIE